MKRRGFLIGLGSALAMPAIVKAGVLMPVRPLVVPGEPMTAIEVYRRQLISEFEAKKRLLSVSVETNLTFQTMQRALAFLEAAGVPMRSDAEVLQILSHATRDAA